MLCLVEGRLVLEAKRAPERGTPRVSSTQLGGSCRKAHRAPIGRFREGSERVLTQVCGGGGLSPQVCEDAPAKGGVHHPQLARQPVWRRQVEEVVHVPIDRAGEAGRRKGLQGKRRRRKRSCLSLGSSPPSPIVTLSVAASGTGGGSLVTTPTSVERGEGSDETFAESVSGLPTAERVRYRTRSSIMSRVCCILCDCASGGACDSRPPPSAAWRGWASAEPCRLVARAAPCVGSERDQSRVGG